MLLLAPPSRRAHDVAISLRAPAGDMAIADLVADEAMGASCPADKAAKVRACILASGRYDCRVSFWIVIPCALASLRETLAEVGASLLVIDEDGEEIADDVLFDRYGDSGGMPWLHAPRRSKASKPIRRPRA